jgi:phosphoglycerate dehydrogenase-like enzyme
VSGLLVSARFLSSFGSDLESAEREAGLHLERIVLPDDPEERLSPDACARIRIAFFSGDVFPERSRTFFAALHGAPGLEWLHVFNAGLDHPIFGRFLERGARISNSSGTSAGPIAQSVVAAVLALARGVLRWRDAQREHAWSPRSRGEVPPDLAGQTLLVYGLGAIGSEVARLARALGLHVVGVRRTPPRRDDPVHEIHPPERLRDLLPRTDWLVLTCPLTEETRGLFDRETLSLLPRGAHVLNVGRGSVLNEEALIEGLKKGHLGGAYLDVFEEEPLPERSPLWDLPNVLVSPHDAAPSRGNERRQAECFLRNLVRFGRGEPLENEARSA